MFRSFEMCFQKLLNHFIQGHRALAMKAELGVVRVEESTASA